jgi:acyl carrier protein
LGGPRIDSVGVGERRDDAEAEVRRFIAENFPLGGDSSLLNSDQSLVEAGVIDSTGVLELIGFVETNFGIEVPDRDLVPENFDSIANVVEYVSRRLES